MLTPCGPNNRTFIGKVLAAWMVVSIASPDVRADAVQADDYTAFWLWAGVRPQPVLNRAEEIYVLAGEVSGHNPARIVSQRSATPRIKSAEVWIVYRAQTIAWDAAVLREIVRQMDVWRSNGNKLVGLQVDFDAGTRNLESYAAFLRKVREFLPPKYALSITGLLDWSANGDPAGLVALAGVVDEVVLQIYQGRKVIPGYESYLGKLDQLRIPFRIGLLQGGEWSAPDHLLGNKYFNGYVVFLVNRVPQPCPRPPPRNDANALLTCS